MTDWVQSSFCSGGDCVRVRLLPDGTRLLWTTNRYPVVEIDPGEWDAFVAGVKAGEFDHLTGEAP